MSDNEESEGPRNEVLPGEVELTVTAEESQEAEQEFRPFDEVHDNFQEERIMMVEQADGMPSPGTGDTESTIPVLSPETLICMGDFSKFVMRDILGRICAEWKRSDVGRHPNGGWYAAKKDAIVLEGHEAPRGEYIQVQPLRPPCQHYGRQLFDFEENPEHQVVYRLCSARRTTEGTFMSVRDIGVYACDLRKPRDVESERHLDDFDKKKVEEGRERDHTQMFNIFNTPRKGGLS